MRQPVRTRRTLAHPRKAHSLVQRDAKTELGGAVRAGRPFAPR